MFWHPLEELHIGCVLGRGLAIILYLPTGFAWDKFLLSLVGVLQLIFLEIWLVWVITLSTVYSYLKDLLVNSQLFQVKVVFSDDLLVLMSLYINTAVLCTSHKRGFGLWTDINESGEIGYIYIKKLSSTREHPWASELSCLYCKIFKILCHKIFKILPGIVLAWVS